jgi:hypothetical protein
MTESTIAELIAKLGDAVPEEVAAYVECRDAIPAFTNSGRVLYEASDAAILALLKVLREERTRVAELEADKEAMRDIITSQTNIVNRQHEQITDLRRAVTRWQWIAREAVGTPDHECQSPNALLLLANLAKAYDAKEQRQ